MIKVLVVDDSFFMRSLIPPILDSDPEIKVIATAKNGAEAMKKIPQVKPDCITLDLAMPGWDGLTTLKHIMSKYPTPVVILSAHSKEDAELTIECLNTGAVSFVLKPSGELSLDIESIKDRLIREVKMAAQVKVAKLKSLVAQKPQKSVSKLIGINKTIVIGASTGGPQTLEAILSALSYDFPASIFVVQHMPTIWFTQSLAEHLNDSCSLAVKVAKNDEIVQANKIYLVPSGYDMAVKMNPKSKEQQQKTDVIIHLNKDDSAGLTPSIDATMKSVAQLYHENIIGIILTGMGDDGVQGMEAIKEAGGKTIVQDKSSLIFGMPRAVIEAGFADKILPASKIAKAMLDMVNGVIVNSR